MTPRVINYVATAARVYQTTPEAIMSRSRTAKVSRARISVYRRLLRDGFSSIQIGGWMGRDSSTIRHLRNGARLER